ncbi:hypothetical protein [Streptomyces sp. NPDC051286]|uniref:hypothetical protein n=1 Tax=Streptomyces sp. NPDC051286 TaxID=3365647 RepID=UPI0037AEB49B
MRHRVTAAALAALTAAAGVTVAGQGAAQAAPTGRTFHVDCSADPAGATGSRQHPWTTLAEAGARTYGPGDQLLFKRGTTCTGTLAPRGTGSARAPFTIADYGSGEARAKLDGAGAHDVVLLSNMQYPTGTSGVGEGAGLGACSCKAED